MIIDAKIKPNCRQWGASTELKFAETWAANLMF